jgi:GT2 family glycosyltransferase
LPDPLVTVVVPTLAADDALADCLRSLESQTFDRFEVVVVDNSGSGRAHASGARVRILVNDRNVGFGAAINQAIRDSETQYIAVLNDDAIPHPGWLAELVKAAEARPKAGMFASEVRMTDTGNLDSAGMLIARDGSSKQRGHGEPPANFAADSDTLFPTGSAALYRRKMLDEIGLFDERFFLYCEDTDLGLRARWAGWESQYAAGAVVDHAYSKSAGRASALKAYYVERNRLYTVIKNFPFSMLALVKFYAFARYCWHLLFMVTRTGKASEFRESGHTPWLLPFLVLRAHASALVRLPYLLGERRRIFKVRRLSSKEFRALLVAHSISVRKVAEL